MERSVTTVRNKAWLAGAFIAMMSANSALAFVPERWSFAFFVAGYVSFAVYFVSAAASFAGLKEDETFKIAVVAATANLLIGFSAWIFAK